MKRFYFLSLVLILLLTACGGPAEPSTAPTKLVPLVERPAGDLTTPFATVAGAETAAPELILELPGRVYDVPWQDRYLLEEGGFTFTDSTIPLFLYTQEELDDGLAKVESYVQKEFLDEEGALRYTDIIGIAPDPLAASEFVSPENRALEGLNYENWAQENYYAHYMDFDVILHCENGQSWGEAGYHIYNISLFRDDATNPTGWRVRLCSRPFQEPAYQDITASLTMGGTAYFEPYRPLTFDELATLGDMGGRVLFATEMLYQENTTWVYVYLEDSNEIVRKEISYSNITAFIPTPALPK